MEFEWDPHKAVANLRKHGVSFGEAVEAFYDPLAVDDIDDAHGSDLEQRFTLIGMSSVRLMIVAHTIRLGDKIRIISACKATRSETKIYEQANKNG
ncbi:MAG: BrnT family toxin [Acidobacteriota bacterium]